MGAECEAAHWKTGSISVRLESGQRIIAKMQSAVALAALLPRKLNLCGPRCRVEPLLHLQRHSSGGEFLNSILESPICRLPFVSQHRFPSLTFPGSPILTNSFQLSCFAE